MLKAFLKALAGSPPTHLRYMMEISEDLDAQINQLSSKYGITKSEIIRQGLGILIAYDGQKAKGLVHIGFASSPQAFDTELTGVLK